MLETLTGWGLRHAVAGLVGFASLLATLVASVMGDEQNERLKNGTFGAVAGTSIGGYAGLVKNQPDLVVVGFFGSVVGAALGWVVYLILANKATKDPKWRTMLDFQVGGLKAVRERLNLDDQQKLLSALQAWRDNFSRMLLEEKSRFMSLPPACFNGCARLTIETWLVTVVDFFAFFFETLANKKNYRSRVTVIIYGKQDNSVVGKHWIHYAGQLAPHRIDQAFDDKSIGYQVLSQQKSSPYFTTSEEAQKKGQKRADDPTYRPFITFRLNKSAILALDWPNELKAESTDPYVEFAQSLFHSVITLAIGEALDRWSDSLQSEVGLQTLA